MVEDYPGGRCQRCGVLAPTFDVTFHRHIGLILIFMHSQVRGRFCRKCVGTTYRECQLTTLLAGWWGLLSFFITPVVLVMNRIRSLPIRWGLEEPELPGDRRGPRADVGAVLLPGPARTGPHPATILAPAIALMVVALLGLLGSSALAIGTWRDLANIRAHEERGEPLTVAKSTSKPDETPAEMRGRLTFNFWMWSAQVVVAVPILAGAIQMARRRTWWLALTGSLLACIPVLGPCCLLGVPFGIWSTVVLCLGSVRAAFAAGA